MVPPTLIAELWKEHASGLLLLIRARFGNQVDFDPEDVLQEAFAKLAKLNQPPTDAVAWLACTARHLAIDVLRSGHRRRQREQTIAAHRQAWFHCTSRETELGDDLSEALLELDEDQREIVVAHLWNSMTFQQIASAFSISSSTANRKYQAALARLKLQLDDRSQPTYTNPGLRE